MEKQERAHGAHVLLVPVPGQGHINPLLQFSKRLLAKGLRVTLAITSSLSKSMHAQPGPIKIETFSDGYDDILQQEDKFGENYFERFKMVGSRTLTELIEKQEFLGDPVSCVVYDAHLPWVLDVAKHLNLIAAAFFPQTCAVSNIYYHVQKGLLTLPVAGPVITIAGLPPLKITDLPSFVSIYGSYPALLSLVINQFSNLDKADWVLFNSFDNLEPEVLKWMAKLWPVKLIGPAVPSIYLDKRIEGDKDYGINLLKPVADACMNWLNMKETGSVVYVSFGSLAELGEEQMKELASCLTESNNHFFFLWIVRKSEEKKLPRNFMEDTVEKGLVVSWCPQLEVLTHKAVGCFLTHCGWNSTLESLCLGVPMVGLPQLADQPTNAKYIEDVLGIGLRAKVDEKGVAVREEIQACVKEIMEGEKGKDIRINAVRWKELAKEAVDEGGSSDKNIVEFVASISCPLKDVIE